MTKGALRGALCLFAMQIPLRMLVGYCLGIVLLRAVESGSLEVPLLLANLLLMAALAPVVLDLVKTEMLSGAVLRDANPVRVRAKTLSIVAGLLLLLVYSSVLARFFGEPFASFSPVCFLLFPLLLVAVPVYVRWQDCRMAEPEDDYARFGAFLCGRCRWGSGGFKTFLLSWCVKIFFVPVMYGGLMTVLADVLTFNWHWSPLTIVEGLFLFGLGFDLLIATSGYLFASALFRNQILAVDDNWVSWCACLICYPPLLTVFRAIREQSDAVLWFHWLQPTEWLYWVWGGFIILTWMIYWLSTASFGLRFSNLTWRGLIDLGPYRYSKHPSYISKNIYWWMHTVPLVGVVDGVDMARNILGLSFVSLVYYLRAKSEEQFLMRYPEYVEYADRIARKGLLARVRSCWR